MIYKFSFIERLLLSKDILPHPLLDSLNLVVAGRSLQVAVKLGIFEILDSKTLTLKDISSKARISEEGALVLLDCLVAMGYVSFEISKYKLSSRAKKFLLSSSDNKLGNMVLFTDEVYKSLNNLEMNVKRGGPKFENLDVFTKEQWQVFNKAMAEIACLDAEAIAKSIPLSPKFKKLLDLGGSHGIHSIECCKLVPGLRAEVLDLNQTKSNAESIISNKKMSKRVKFRSGNFLIDDLGRDYDIVLAFNVIHGLTDNKNMMLANKVYKSLNKGGIYVILDQIKEASGKSQLAKFIPATMGVMLFNQSGGRTYSQSEVCKWMENVGFDKTSFKKMRNPGNGLIIGYKS